MRQWEKFANSLRLRHALRIADKAPEIAFPIIQEIIDGKLPLIEEGDEVVMIPEDQNWLKLSTSWSFREHKKLRLGSTMWNVLSETDSADGSGIYDPRAFLFFEPNNAKKWAAFPQVPSPTTLQASGIPYQQHRDVSYDFKGQDNIYSPLNYYLTRDEKQVPEIIMTAAEIRFVKAEIYLRGLGVAVNVPFAETEYSSGVATSIKFWQDVMVNTDSWVNKPPILSSGDIFMRINHNRLSIFNPNNDKLELIYQQRWVDAFRQPWEAFSLLRRTNATPREGAVNDFYRFTYPPSETEKNPENWNAQVAKMGRDANDVKCWWMP
ncbi:SusD/RagB family nutrient-binding outer membrane lipoprotein [bacterium]|nr:SusD/RagB family nutrient-binding outer membrane lipoprotein [bacterium]